MLLILSISGAPLGVLVSLTKKFKNRFQWKIEDNFTNIKRKTSGQVRCQSQQLPGGEERREGCWAGLRWYGRQAAIQQTGSHVAGMGALEKK